MKTIPKAIVLAAIMLSSCRGAGDQDTEDKENAAVLDNAVAFPISASYRVYLEDEIFSLSCNQYYAEFWTSPSKPVCTAVSVDVTYETVDGDTLELWSVASPNETVELSLKQPKGTEDKLSDGDNEYFCYLGSGDIFERDGEDSYGSGLMILSSAVAMKPSDLVAKPESIFAVTFANARGCEAIHKK
jgi:hypothetical protein